MNPDQFDNIFLGIGGFHNREDCVGLSWLFLEPSGIYDVIVERTECYGAEQ